MGNAPVNQQQAEDIIDDALASAIHVTRCAVSKSIGMAPGALVFCRDMFINLPIIADLIRIQEHRQELINDNLRRQNLKRREFHYQVGQQVLIKSINPKKLQAQAHGPYPIIQVHTNGTVDVARNNHVTERINIRCLIPYRP